MAVQVAYKKLARCGPQCPTDSALTTSSAACNDPSFFAPCGKVLVGVVADLLTVTDTVVVWWCGGVLVWWCKWRTRNLLVVVLTVSNGLCPHNTISCLQRPLVRSAWKGSGRCRG